MSKNSTTESARDSRGQFLPGNALWRANAFEVGHPGFRPNKFTPKEAHQKIVEYFDNQEARKKGPNLSGIRVALGLLSPNSYHQYENGEFGKTEEEKRAYKDVFAWARLILESYAEEELFKHSGQVAGPIFSLKSRHGHKDTQHIKHESNTTVQYIIDLPDNRPEMLEAQANSIDIEFGTTEQENQ